MLDFSVTCIGSALFQHCPGEAGEQMHRTAIESRIGLSSSESSAGRLRAMLGGVKQRGQVFYGDRFDPLMSSRGDAARAAWIDLNLPNTLLISCATSSISRATDVSRPSSLRNATAIGNSA